MSLIAVFMGTFEHSHGGHEQLPVTGDTEFTTSCSTSCLKGLHQHQPGTNTLRTQHHSSSSCPQGWTQKAQGRQRPGRMSFLQWREAESKLLRCGAPTLSCGTFPGEWRQRCRRGLAPSLLLFGHLGEHLLRHRQALKPGLLETTQPLTSQAYIPHVGPFSRSLLPPSFITLGPHYANVPLDKQGRLRSEPMHGKQG